MKDLNELSSIVVDAKERARVFRERRIPEWDENYSLFRDKVRYNRLTQRQTVNLPLMKMAIKTILKDIDDPPLLRFKDKANDEQKEVFFNELWKEVADRNRLLLKDIVDKKQVMIYGRSYKKIRIMNGELKIDIVDPYDVLIGRDTDPTDINSATFVAQTNIFRPLSEILENEMFDLAAKRKIKRYFREQGTTQMEANTQTMIERNQRLEEMGATQEMLTPVQEGLTFVQLSEVYLRLDDGFWYLVTAEADGDVVLFAQPLEAVLGETPDHFWRNHLPITSWADDVENTDWFSDGVADILRTPAKILNSWFSQLVENRTLRNFGMHYYDNTDRDFIPQTFVPVPWGWYGVPGNPNEVIKKVDIPDLSDSLDEIQFVLNMAERASAVTTTQQGVVNDQKVTLGEIQLAFQSAKERVQSMAKYYMEDWRDFGIKYAKLLESMGDEIDAVMIERKGRVSSKLYHRTIEAKDWQSKLGYTVEVKNVSQLQNQTLEQLQKIQYAKSLMPQNRTLDELIKQKALEFAELDAMDIQKVLEEEKQNQEMGVEPQQQQVQTGGLNNGSLPQG